MGTRRACLHDSRGNLLRIGVVLRKSHIFFFTSVDSRVKVSCLSKLVICCGELDKQREQQETKTLPCLFVAPKSPMRSLWSGWNNLLLHTTAVSNSFVFSSLHTTVPLVNIICCAYLHFSLMKFVACSVEGQPCNVCNHDGKYVHWLTGGKE